MLGTRAESVSCLPLGSGLAAFAVAFGLGGMLDAARCKCEWRGVFFSSWSSR